MNSLELRKLKNLRLKSDNIDLALRYYQLVDEKINEIFDQHCKAKDITESYIENIFIEDDIKVLYRYYDGNEYVTDVVTFQKSLLTVKPKDLKNAKF
jgi:ssRNA-specific RNase YbeY (16S rRNA maturation enzyme)